MAFMYLVTYYLNIECDGLLSWIYYTVTVSDRMNVCLYIKCGLLYYLCTKYCSTSSMMGCQVKVILYSYIKWWNEITVCLYIQCGLLYYLCTKYCSTSSVMGCQVKVYYTVTLSDRMNVCLYMQCGLLYYLCTKYCCTISEMDC